MDFVLIAGIVAGLVLITLGLRGRRVAPVVICAGCQFELTGLVRTTEEVPAGGAPPTQPQRPCPECGSPLGAIGSIRIRCRVRRGRLALLGTLVVVVAAAALIVPRAFAPRVAAAKPTGWLISDLQSAGLTTATEAANELRVRVKRNSLDQAQIQRAIAAILTRQADLARPWPAAEGDALLEWHAAGKVPGPSFSTFMAQSIPMKLTGFPAHLQLGVSLEVRLGPARQIGTRFAANGSIWYRAYPSLLSLDGVQMVGVTHQWFNTGAWDHRGGPHDSTAVNTWSPAEAWTFWPGGHSSGNDPAIVGRIARSYDPISPSLGPHTLHVEYVVEFGLAGSMTVEGSRTLRLDGEFTVHDDLAQAMNWRSDPASMRVIAQSLTLQPSGEYASMAFPRVPITAPLNECWGVGIELRQVLDGVVSTPFAGDFMLVIGDREWPIGEHIVQMGDYSGGRSNSQLFATAFVQGIRIEDWQHARLWLRPRASASPQGWRTEPPPTLLSDSIELADFALLVIRTPRGAIPLEERIREQYGQPIRIPMATAVLEIRGGAGKPTQVVDRSTPR